MRLSGAIALLTLVMCAQAQAQTYPTRPVRMVVGFPPGGFTDILARQIGDRLTPVMGQTIVIDNRAGSAGIIGADIVAKSKPDGYTLLMGHNNSNAVAPSLYAKLPYDVRRDFAPIALAGSVATLLVVHPSVPAKSVKDFIAVAGSTKGQLRVWAARSIWRSSVLNSLPACKCCMCRTKAVGRRRLI
jgi:tripartite-type tricarboxylate transporter receptor subunit TctC